MDDVHEHVFVSGGPTSNGIVVTDFRGRVVTQINGQFGATGLELSADKHSLFVALAAGDAISVIDTATLAETARHDVGSRVCPKHLARTGTTVWFGYGCENDFTGGIGKLDLAATPPAVSLNQHGDALFLNAPLLASVTADAGPVVAAQLALSLSTVRVFEVAHGALAPVAAGDVAGSGLADLSLSSDGATLFTAAGSRDHVEAFAPGTLSGRGSYATGPHPNSVSVAPGDDFVAMAVTTSRDDDVLVYRDGGTTPVRTVDVPSTDTVATRGLAWSGDLRLLFVVTQGGNDAAPRLNVVSRPTGD